MTKWKSWDDWLAEDDDDDIIVNEEGYTPGSGGYGTSLDRQVDHEHYNTDNLYIHPDWLDED